MKKNPFILQIYIIDIDYITIDCCYYYLGCLELVITLYKKYHMKIKLK